MKKHNAMLPLLIEGDDTLWGDGQSTNTGNDYLDGGDGSDTLWGGNGDELFSDAANEDEWRMCA